MGRPCGIVGHERPPRPCRPVGALETLRSPPMPSSRPSLGDAPGPDLPLAAVATVLPALRLRMTELVFSPARPVDLKQPLGDALRRAFGPALLFRLVDGLGEAAGRAAFGRWFESPSSGAAFARGSNAPHPFWMQLDTMQSTLPADRRQRVRVVTCGGASDAHALFAAATREALERLGVPPASMAEPRTSTPGFAPLAIDAAAEVEVRLATPFVARDDDRPERRVGLACAANWIRGRAPPKPFVGIFAGGGGAAAWGGS